MTAESFKQQFLPFHPKLYRIAFALVGNKDDAEDILQEAYCKLWRKRYELGGIRNAEAFLVTLVKNSCVDHLRSPRTKRHELLCENVAVPDGTSPAKDLESKEAVAQVKRLICQLPANQQQVLRLHGLSECSPQEIEELTGLSAVNVRTLLSRARKTIREQFKQRNEL